MRQALGLIVGFVVAVLASTLIEYVAHLIEPGATAPVGPVSAQMAALVLIGWVAGTFAGAVVGDLIARRAWPGYVIAVIIVATVIYTVMQNDHPLWLSLGGIVGPLVAAWVAARFLPNTADPAPPQDV